MPDVERARAVESDIDGPGPGADEDAPRGERDGSRRVAWLGLIATLTFAGAGSLLAYTEGLPAALSRGQVDKALHFGVGGALAFFLDPILRRRMLRTGPVTVPVAALVILLPAGLEEILQGWSPHRDSSFWDFAADACGVAFGLWLSRRVGR